MGILRNALKSILKEYTDDNIYDGDSSYYETPSYYEGSNDKTTKPADTTKSSTPALKEGEHDSEWKNPLYYNPDGTEKGKETPDSQSDQEHSTNVFGPDDDFPMVDATPVTPEESEATKQAHALGLISAGWGNWKDEDGRTVAHTIDGVLVKSRDLSKDQRGKIGMETLARQAQNSPKSSGNHETDVRNFNANRKFLTVDDEMNETQDISLTSLTMNMIQNKIK